MSAYFEYLIEANLILVVLYLYYKLFLSKSRQFGLVRTYLMGSLVAAFSFPLFSLPGSDWNMPEGLTAIQSLPEEVIGAAQNGVGEINLWNWAGWAYGLVVTLLGIFFLYQIATLLLRVRSGQRRRRGSYVEVRNTGAGPSSFGPFLFWEDQLDSQSGASHIHAHERAHIQQWHSIDLLALRIAWIASWFNPLLFLYARDLKQLHEFLADKATLRHASSETVSKLILARTLGVDALPLVNSFHSHTHNRIIMLNKTKSKPKRLALLLALPMMAMVFLMSAAPEEMRLPIENPVEELGPDEPDVFPQPLNMSEVAQAIGYPQEAKDNNIEEKVIVRILVGKKGEIIRYEYFGKPNKIFTEAIDLHIRELRFSPGKKDGKALKVWVTVPFQFKLKGEE